MRILPRTLRARLTLILALITVVLSALVAGFVDIEYRTSLTAAIDTGLHSRFEAVAGQVRHTKPHSMVRPALPDDESFAQVISPLDNVVAAAPPALRNRPAIGHQDLANARDRRVTLVRDSGPRGERARLLAGPSGPNGDVIVVGTSLAEATRAQHRLELALAVGLPGLTLLVTAAAWFLTGAALSPVSQMIEEADAISARVARQPRRRLSVTARRGAELSELARRLNRLLERLDNALEHERSFLDDASHELRTPIAIARGELELARSQASEDPATSAALGSALEEIDRLDHLAASLLVLARTRAANDFPATTFGLGGLSQDAVAQAFAANKASHANHAIVPSIHGDVTISGDRPAIERAVRNVVENALRYARREVNVTITSKQRVAVVEIRDDGPGFPGPLIVRGIGRFATHGRTGHPGAGLGLAIVDAIATAHGGSVELANAGPDGGAVVRLRVPISPTQ